ncbi:unnamed protein product [Malus baccata var. baccata]
MSGPSDRRFDLNLGEEAAMPSQDNIWHPSFISLTGLLTVEDSVMKNDMTAAVVSVLSKVKTQISSKVVLESETAYLEVLASPHNPRNFVTPKDNRLLSKRSDELAIKDSLALSVQCTDSVSNMT